MDYLDRCVRFFGFQLSELIYIVRMTCGLGECDDTIDVEVLTPLGLQDSSLSMLVPACMLVVLHMTYVLECSTLLYFFLHPPSRFCCLFL